MSSINNNPTFNFNYSNDITQKYLNGNSCRKKIAVGQEKTNVVNIDDLNIIVGDSSFFKTCDEKASLLGRKINKLKSLNESIENYTKETKGEKAIRALKVAGYVGAGTFCMRPNSVKLAKGCFSNAKNNLLNGKKQQMINKRAKLISEISNTYIPETNPKNIDNKKSSFRKMNIDYSKLEDISSESSLENISSSQISKLSGEQVANIFYYNLFCDLNVEFQKAIPVN